MESNSGKQTLSWLLEQEDPGVRYLAMRDLQNVTEGNPELQDAKERAHLAGPIATIIDEMDPEGYWVEPGPGYYPKYRGTVWSLIMLGQLGASIDMDPRIENACGYLLEHALTVHGQFSMSGSPSGTADCLQGNLCTALLELGVEDPRLESAFEWMARSVTGESVAPKEEWMARSVTGESVAPKEEKKAEVRYYAGKCGPLFACGSNNKLSCAWGGVKVMGAFSKLPPEKRTSLIERAIEAGVDFFLGVDPLEATYPSGWNDKPSGNWWKFGFPVFYVTDMLQNVEALVRLGYGSDPRLTNALEYIASKRDQNGRWSLEYSYTDKTWVDFGAKKEPNKWVTLRAARVLQDAAG
jgi:hypothetical protein